MDGCLDRWMKRLAADAAPVLILTMLAASTSSARVTKTCLTGTAPEVANDATQIRALRALIDTQCVCASFDGSPGKTHKKYVACAAAIISSEATAGHLRTQCKATVKTYYAKATCGTNPNLHVQPCISTNVTTGKITCAIKPTTKKDGTTASPACTDTAKSTRVHCSEYTTCIDAADTDGNLIVGSSGDTGACVLRQGDACSGATNCVTGHCADGVCCDTACNGTCQACTAALTGGTTGACASASSGLDPRNDCPNDGVASCGRTGVCNGAAACQLYAANAVCNAAACVGLLYTPADFCNGSGTCVASGSTNCDDGNVCTTDSCSALTGCGHVNNTAPCDDGAACTIDDTCAGGTCAGTQLNHNLRAAITQEIDSVDAQNNVHLTVQITTLTDLPFQLTATGLDFPTGFVLDSLGSTCTLETNDYRCYHTATLLATSACADNGNYHMYLSYSCTPAINACNLCSAPETIDFTLNNSNFCNTTVVSTCGNSQLDPGEQCDGTILNGQTCQSLGFFSGSLACAADCSFDTSGCRRSRAFVTSTTYSGILGGLSGADAICASRASAATLGGTWTAWLSSSTVDAKDRIPGVEYRLVDNTTVVCTDQTDLLDGSPTANISKNEFGASDGPNVWTGTNNNGTKTASTCFNWLSTFGLGTYGANDFPVASMVWSASGLAGCSDPSLHLYCFEQLPYKRVFVTSTTSNGSLGGLNGADAFCQARAEAATLGGTWKAWLSTSTVNAKDRVPDAQYRLVDRATIIANNKADLIDGSIDANINEDELGATRTPNVWTGTNADGTSYALTCNDWTSAATSVKGLQGKNDFPPASGQWTSYGQVDCDVAWLHLYCFEQ